MNKNKVDIANYLKHYGFLLPNAAIYGGLAKSWDLGPYGTELKRNLKKLWWKYFITTSPYNVGCDSLLITHPRILEASGHQKNFHDWLVECNNCRKRQRLDHLLDTEGFYSFLSQENKNSFSVLKECPDCHQKNFSPPRQFNLLLSTNLEITAEKENFVYLRPETCQGIFVNFSAIQKSTHKKLPFGIGQIGKSFRNEITLHHGIFRTREFEQMELEFFSLPNERELCSNSQRGNYDLLQHSKYSQKDLSVGGIIPEVVEVSFGVERLMLAILEDSYSQEATREILKLHPLLAPYFVAIIPLSQQLEEFAYQLYCNLLNQVQFNLIYGQANNAVGTYYCVTVDFQSQPEQKITLRHRNSREQTRVSIASLAEYLNQEYLNY
ncbi:23584_t:CDS:2 [Gigaspora margarita]|uniref:23584_t:CDS:1 n=1 Tax=Gigaspora margarita TaxID=4874 RepID=A0ABM8VZ29_GIGMA|nr:23584_t:CDS:2 [Gigaspora margarita]